MAATAWKWPTPALEYPLITFVDRSHVRPKRDPGYCYLVAGWEVIDQTPSGLVVLGCPLANVPKGRAPLGAQLEAFA